MSGLPDVRNAALRVPGIGARSDERNSHRSKIGYGVLGVTVAFLLATNPVVVNAAGLITSQQIKNETIKSKDIKNNKVKGIDIRDGSLTAADLAPGTIPAPAAVQLKSVKRFLSTVQAAVPNSATLAFVGGTTTVTVDGNDVTAATATFSIFDATEGDDYDYAICYRPVGAVTPPVPLGGAAAVFNAIDKGQNEVTFSATGADVLAAGNYTIGICLAPDPGNVSATFINKVHGWVQVVDGSGPLAKPAAGPTAAAHE